MLKVLRDESLRWSCWLTAGLICAGAPVSHRSQQKDPRLRPAEEEEEEGRGRSNMEASVSSLFYGPRGGCRGFSQRSMMECKFLWVQITPTDSGPPGAPPDENRRRYLGNGEWLLEKNILSFSLIRCSWRFRALLLNCSFYGYRHLHQKLFQRVWPCVSRP